MARPGLFDAELSKTGLFDAELNKGGIFDPDLITTAAVAAAPTVIADDGEQFRLLDVIPRSLAVDDWLPLVPLPPLFERSENDRSQVYRDWRVTQATGEIDTGLLPIVPPTIHVDEPSRSFETRAQQEEDPWHTFFQISIPPPPTTGWDDYEGHRYTDWRYGNQTLEAEIVGSPILPAPGWDEVEWQKFWGLGYAGPTGEEDLGATPIIPGLAREEDLSRSMDTRFANAEEEPWQTFFTIPTPPPNQGWDDWDWSKWYDLRVSQSEEEPRQIFFSIPNLSFDEDPGRNIETRAKQEEDHWQTFFTIPAAPPNQGWDDWDWSRDFSIKYAPPREPEASDFSRPVSPAFGWFDDPLQRYADSGLSQLLVFEEFVNAPSGALPGPFVGCEGGFWMLHSLAASGADMVGGLAASGSATVSGLSASGAETVTGMAAGSFCNFSSLSITVFEVICKE
jgi:hypothetical protein